MQRRKARHESFGAAGRARESQGLLGKASQARLKGWGWRFREASDGEAWRWARWFGWRSASDVVGRH